MNMQEQIEKMREDFKQEIVIYKETLIDFDTTAKNLLTKGYINGADFVEWLKSSRFVKPYMDDVDYCMGIDIEMLNEALQEYLKGE